MIDSEARQSKLDGIHGGTTVMHGGVLADFGHDRLGRAQLWLQGDLVDLAGVD